MSAPRSDNRAVFSTSLRLAATAERIFSVWLDPDMVKRWMSLSNETALGKVDVTVDARVGGRFFMVDHSDGIPLEHEGVYLAMEPYRLLEFSYSMPQYGRDIDHITITIEPVDGGCQMDIRHELDAQWAGHKERIERGWNMRLQAIKTIAEHPL